MTHKRSYDMAIIGGGLAGLALAIQCGKKGYDVVMFEKEEYPFHKVCGEYISLESRDFLEGLGLPVQRLHLPLIKRLEASDVTGKSLHISLPLGGFGISRYLLDFSLYQLAIENNVQVFTNCKVSGVRFTNDRFFYRQLRRFFSIGYGIRQLW